MTAARTILRTKLKKLPTLRCVRGWPDYVDFGGQVRHLLTEDRIYFPMRVTWDDSTGWWVQLIADDGQRRSFHAEHHFEIARVQA